MDRRSRPEKAFGLSLARERKRQCKSMTALARKATTHASEISRLERGLRDPRLSTMVRLADALDVSLGTLVGDVTRSEGVEVAGSFNGTDDLPPTDRCLSVGIGCVARP